MNRIVLLCLASASALFLAPGCATLDVDEDALVAAKTAEIPVEWQVTTETIRAESFADLYADPILARYLDQALNQNFDLQQARLRIQRADAQLEQFRARRRPQLNSSAGAGLSALLNDLDDPADSASLGLTGTFNPDLFGRLQADIKGADARAQITRAETARLSRTILAGVVTSYLSAIEADLLLTVAEQNLEFLAETERVTRARFEAGDIAGSDLALSELEVQSARAAVAEQRFAADDAKRALSILVGGFGDETLAGLPDLPRSLPTLVTNTIGLPDTPAVTLSRRFDVQASRLGVADAAASLDAVRADDLPGASLSASLSGSRPFEDLFDIDTYVAALGASLSYNVLDGGTNTAREIDAQAALDLAVSNYAETLRLALRDIRSTIALVEALQQSLAALQAAEQSAERALELEGVRFDLGEAILLDVLTVQRRVDAIRSSRLRTERRYLDAISRAHLAAGPV